MLDEWTEVRDGSRAIFLCDYREKKVEFNELQIKTKLSHISRLARTRAM
jgi:hypothetical protein